MFSLENSVILNEARGARHKAHPAVQFLIFIVVFLAGGLAMSIVIGLPVGMSMVGEIMQTVDPADIMSGNVDINALTKQLMESMPEWYNVLNLFGTVFTTLAVIIYCRKIEGRSFASMGLRKKGFGRNYCVGYLIGLVMMLAAEGLAVVTGAASFTGFNSGVSWLYIGLFFLGFMVQGMSEEFLCRGYFAVSLANRTKTAVAVGISSIVFAMLHLANQGIAPLAFINLALFGAFMGIYMFRTDDLWGACAIHSAWNFVQGNVLGVSVSGGGQTSSVFGTAFVEGRELINGGAFGLEGGVCTTAVLLAAIALTLFVPMKPREALPEKQEQVTETEKNEIPLYIQK